MCLFSIMVFHYPYQAFMDEFSSYGSGMKLYKHSHFASIWVTHGIINPYITEASAYILGESESFMASRIANGIIALFTVLAAYLLARKLFDEKVAILSGVFLISSPYFIVSSHRELSDNPATLFFILTLLAFVRYWEKQSTKNLFILSFFFSLSLASKLTVGPYLAILIFLLFLKHRFKLKKSFTSSFLFVLLTGLLFFMIFPHTLLYFRDFYNEFMGFQISRTGKDIDPFRTGEIKNFLSGYKFYYSELKEFGFPYIVMVLSFLGIVYYSLSFLKKNSSSDDLKKLIVFLPAAFGFLFYGSFNSYYMRYLMPIFPLIAISAAAFTFSMLREKLKKHIIPVTFLKIIICGIIIFSLLFNFRLIWKINEVKKRRTEFFALTHKIKQYEKKGDIIVFDFPQGFTFDSSNFGHPYGAYPLMMSGIDEKTILVYPPASAIHPEKFDILITTNKISDEKLILLDEVSPSPEMEDEILAIEFGSKERYKELLKTDPSYAEKQIHFMEKEGGGYPTRFFIYTTKEQNKAKRESSASSG